MWICPECHEEVQDDFEVCWNCQNEKDGMPSNKPFKMHGEANSNNTHSDYDAEGNNNGGFFSFRVMVSRSLIQIIYVIGMIAFSIAGIWNIVISFSSKYGSGENLIMGLGLLIFGNLIWRIICEGSILLFNIHDVLVSIERKY